MLNNLLQSLYKRESSNTVFNQYANKYILNNLRLYLDYIYRKNSRILLVGEAPGYYGCRQTGIPFTSGAIIQEAKHGLFQEIGEEIVLSGKMSENTATIFWDCICNFSAVPVIWNTFPFHPHQSRLPEKNRKPNSIEITEGKEYLNIIYEIFKPKMLCAIGRTAERVLGELFPLDNPIYIRHPSHGGKRDFVEGIQNILKMT